MKKEWYAEWSDIVVTQPKDVRGEPEIVSLPGNSSFSHYLKTALEFATKELKTDHDPVLFVLAFQNYMGISGMNMNNDAYSAFPSEGELLVAEGCSVFVLDVEKDIVIKNDRPSFSSFNGHKLTVIYLFVDDSFQ